MLVAFWNIITVFDREQAQKRFKKWQIWQTCLEIEESWLEVMDSIKSSKIKDHKSVFLSINFDFKQILLLPEQVFKILSLELAVIVFKLNIYYLPIINVSSIGRCRGSMIFHFFNWWYWPLYFRPLTGFHDFTNLLFCNKIWRIFIKNIKISYKPCQLYIKFRFF